MVNYAIVKDEKFGYYKLDPTPSQEDVERYYLEEFYSAEYKNFNNSLLKVQKKDQDFFDSRWEKICEIIEEFHGDLAGRSLFDIGFGFAQALIYFKKQGLEVSGIEPSPEGVDYARSQGLDVYKGGIEEFDIVKQKFDVVTLNNVLEHLRNPYDVLVSIKDKLLKDNGLLAIDVPNEYNAFQVIANEEYGLKEWWVCPPNHINYFSCKSLSKILEAAGYEIVSQDASFPMEMFMLFGDVYVGNAEVGKECHQKRVRFEKLMAKYGKSDKLKKIGRAHV